MDSVRPRSKPQTRRRRASSSGLQLSTRQCHVLQILDAYGWCTAEMVRQIARVHGVSVKMRRIYVLLCQLLEMRAVISEKIMNGRKGDAYAASESGIEYLKQRGHALNCDTNVRNDPASMHHFLAVNSIMAEFGKVYLVNFWLSDFQVRSERMAQVGDGLAKDYDSVAELQVDGAVVRIGIEFETAQQRSSRYAELCGVFAAETFLHLVIYFFKKDSLLGTIAPQLQKVGGMVGFVCYDDFRKYVSEAELYYWNNGQLSKASLHDFLFHLATTRKRPDYIPIVKLSLDLEK